MTDAIGFIGVGTMGLPMARNLLAHGIDLVVWNRTSERCRSLADDGATVAASLDGLFEASATVLLMLAGEEAIDDVLGRGSARFERFCRGRTIVLLSTTSAAYSRTLGDEIRSAHGRYVEAPVSGSRIPAERGELLLMLAGDRADLAHVRPLLAPLGRALDCGRVPEALLMKHATNLVLSPALVGLAEGTAFARHAGLDLDLFTEIVLNSQMASDIVRAKLPRLLARDYTPQGAVRSAVDSLTRTVATANELGFEPHLIRRCLELLAEAAEAGLAEEDIVAIEKVLGRHDGSRKPSRRSGP